MMMHPVRECGLGGRVGELDCVGHAMHPVRECGLGALLPPPLLPPPRCTPCVNVGWEVHNNLHIRRYT